MEKFAMSQQKQALKLQRRKGREDLEGRAGDVAAQILIGLFVCRGIEEEKCDESMLKRKKGGEQDLRNEGG